MSDWTYIIIASPWLGNQMKYFLDLAKKNNFISYVLMYYSRLSLWLTDNVIIYKLRSTYFLSGCIRSFRIWCWSLPLLVLFYYSLRYQLFTNVFLLLISKAAYVIYLNPVWSENSKLVIYLQLLWHCEGSNRSVIWKQRKDLFCRKFSVSSCVVTVSYS